MRAFLVIPLVRANLPSLKNLFSGVYFPSASISFSILQVEIVRYVY